MNICVRFLKIYVPDHLWALLVLLNFLRRNFFMVTWVAPSQPPCQTSGYNNPPHSMEPGEGWCACWWRTVRAGYSQLCPVLPFIYALSALIFQNCFLKSAFFSNFGCRRSYFVSEMKIKSGFYFAFRSTFRNFGRNRRISLYKGSLEDWGKNGLRIGDRTQFFVLL